MKKLLLLVSLAALCLCQGCRSTLAPGGAYAPVVITTNANGTTVTNQAVFPDPAFYQAEVAFKTAYDLINGVFEWERANRAFLWSVSPNIKHSLDNLRPTAAAVVKQYGIARLAYIATPTPAGMDLVNTILAKMKQLQSAAVAIQQTSTPK